MIATCQYCGKLFKTQLAIVKRGHGKCCSHSCSNKYRYSKEENRAKLSKTLKDYYLVHKSHRSGKKLTKEHRRSISLFQKGRKRSLEHQQKLNEAQRGSPCYKTRGKLHYRWKGGGRNRGDFRDKAWRYEVFCRDNFTCQDCGYTGNKLTSHHKKLFSEFPHERYNVDNGITLCKECHEKEHKRLNHSYSHLIRYCFQS